MQQEISNKKQVIRGTRHEGFLFLEILIAVALISVVFVALLGVGFLSVNISSSIKKATQADALAKEELEELRNFRDGTTWATTGLGNVTLGQNYYLTFNSGTSKYQLNSGTETVNGYTRSIVFSAVSRDANGAIVSSGGSNDPNTRQAVSTVSGNGVSQQVVIYLTNWQNK
jgi:type II secretory pathway pseudopilin PulG